MTTIDPTLPAHLRWAANQVDTILADPFWQAELWRDGHYTVGDASDIRWWLEDGSWTSQLWVGRSASAHTQEMKKAGDLVRAAYQRLVALRDEIERQAQVAVNQLEVQSLVDQLTNLLRQF